MDAITKTTQQQHPQYAENKFKKAGVNISGEAIDLLIERCSGDVSQFENEFIKLKNYSNDITLNDVKKIVFEPLNDNNFEILNSLVNGKYSKALKVYRDLKIMNVEPTTLISMLVTQLKFYDQVFYLYNEKKIDISSISKELKTSDKRIYYITKNVTNLNGRNISNLIHQLYLLDLKIKTGQIDRFFGFEMFILNFQYYMK